MRPRIVSLLCALTMTVGAGAAIAAPARRPARPAAKRPPPPRLLLTLPPAAAGGADLRAALQAWTAAVRAEPLTLDDLGLKNPSPGRRRWELQRRRLQHWEVTLRLDRLEHGVEKGAPPRLLGLAQVTVTLKRLDRRAKAPVTLTAPGRVAVPSSAALQGEILAIRQAALEAAVAAALQQTLARLLRTR